MIRGAIVKIEVIEANENNIHDILNLMVNKKQEDFIETTKECLEEAKECPYFKPVGLYIDDILIGFAMYGAFPHEIEETRIWFDRFLIDHKYQHKGYGRLLFAYMLEYLYIKYKENKIYLSIYPQNTIAIKMYQSLGFIFNGEKDVNGEDVMVLNIKQA